MIDPPVYHGEYLRKAIEELTVERKALIEGFLFENSILMLYAADGLGKSTINLQSAIEASAGVPVFGGLPVERPLNIIYVVAERHISEPFERIKKMLTKTKIDYDHISFCNELQGLNIMDEKDQDVAMKILSNHASHFKGRVDLIDIDPYYALCSGSFLIQEHISSLNNFLKRLQAEFGCSIKIVHHENRGSRNEKGKRTAGDMYGNRFLSAPLTGKYRLAQADDRSGVILTKEKDSYNCLLNEITLKFDEETYVSTISSAQHFATKILLVCSFINHCLKANKKFTKSELKQAVPDVAPRYLDKIIGVTIADGFIRNCNSKFEKALYEVLKEIKGGYTIDRYTFGHIYT